MPSWRNAGDAELAVAAADGDRQAFAEIYDRYAHRLYDFCVGLVGQRDAADCVQDAFCVAATNLTSLREPDRLRPWLYSIARHHAMRRLRDYYREQVSDDLPDAASLDAGPETVAGQSELAKLVADAAGGLSDRDRTVLELTYRHGLDGPELAEALGVTLTNANTLAFRLRQTIERSLGALLVARGVRTNRNACPELAAILVGWDGQFTILMRKRIARHIESCTACEQDQHRRTNPVALLGSAPLFIPAPDWLRSQALHRVQLTSASSAMHDAVRASGRGNRSVLPVAALLVGIPLIGLGLTLAWLRPLDTSVAPAAVSGTESATSRVIPTTAPTASALNSPPPTPAPSPTPAQTRNTARTTAVPSPALTTPYRAPTTTTAPTTPEPTPEVTTSEVTRPALTTTERTPDTTTPEVTTPAVTTSAVTTPALTTTEPTPDVTTPMSTPSPVSTPNPTPQPTSVVPDGPVIH